MASILTKTNYFILKKQVTAIIHIVSKAPLIHFLLTVKVWSGIMQAQFSSVSNSFLKRLKHVKMQLNTNKAQLC